MDAITEQKYSTAGCRHCWWREGGRCYVDDPERDENGRSKVVAKNRCEKFWGKRAALETVIPSEKLMILSERHLNNVGDENETK